jgi:hypothetical protein
MSKEERTHTKKDANEKFRDLEEDFFFYENNTHIAYYKSIPTRFKKLFLKLFAGEIKNRNQAIKAKCLECVAYEDVNETIGRCQVKLCPIWNFRPYQKEKND